MNLTDLPFVSPCAVLFVSFTDTQLTVKEGEGEVALAVTGSIPSQCSYQVQVTTASGTAGGESRPLSCP